MGETNTEPVKPVLGALSLSGDRGDKKKHQPRKCKRHCEKELEKLSKELANCKVQLEAKHGAHMQALLKLEQNQKMTYELSTLMKKSDTERNKYMNECKEGRARILELESKINDMTNKLFQQSHVSSDDDDDEHITISLKEYKSLVREAKKATNNEVEASSLKTIEELRAQAEEALKRAELAEKGKVALEDKMKRQREHRHRKRAALAALREVSTPQHFTPSTSYGTPKVYQPLGKVLNIKL